MRTSLRSISQACWAIWYFERGSWRHSISAPITATTRAEDAPRPEPGGASVSRKNSIPVP